MTQKEQFVDHNSRNISLSVFPEKIKNEMDADEQLRTKLKEIWAKSQDWQETPTSEEGIFIVKYPMSGINQAYLGIKFKKNLTAKKGVYIKSRKEIAIFQNLFNHKEFYSLFNQIAIDRNLQKRIGLLGDWDQIPTPIPGISYTKMPYYGDPAYVAALAINPVNDLGNKMKKKDLYIRNHEELEKFRLLFNNEKLDRLSRIIEEVNYELSLEMRVAQSKVMRMYK